MLKILLEFFAVHERMSIPGIGTFTARREPAEDNFGNKTIIPATTNILFNPEQDKAATGKFEKFVEEYYNKPQEEIIQFYNRLANKLKYESLLNIDGLGILANEGGVIKFRQSFNEIDFFPAIPVEKVIRDNAEHTLTVGENERTSSQMREALANRETKSQWWVYVLIVLLVAGAGYFFYVYYFRK